MLGSIVAVTLVILVLAGALSVLCAIPRGDRSPYCLRTHLCSAAELAFLRVLDEAVGRRYRVLTKVRVADVIGLRCGLAPPLRRAAFHRICARHFDFVLCEPLNLAIVGVIELNDASHARKDRARRDAFILGICNAIGLPILMVRCRHEYSLRELRAIVKDAFEDTSSLRPWDAVQ